jgi:MSHA pilin protein MshD
MTLIELIVFIVIVSVGLAGVLAALNVAVKGSADPLQPKQALAIAEGLMEAVLLKPYNTATTPGTCPATCVYIGDYSGVSASPVSGYTAVIGVAAENTSDLGVAARKVTVTVTQPDGKTIALTGYRASY